MKATWANIVALLVFFLAAMAVLPQGAALGETIALTGVTATAGREFQPAGWTVDTGSITMPIMPSSTVGNDPLGKGMWLSADDPVGHGDNWIKFSFSSPQHVAEMAIWNYNQNATAVGYDSAWRRGLKDVQISYYQTGDDLAGPGHPWNSYVLHPATGSATQAVTDVLAAPGGGISDVVAVKMAYTSNWGDLSDLADWDAQNGLKHFGLSQVAFFESVTAIPEPASVTLLSAVLFGLAACVWRCRKRAA
jgi:hypothetical protein